MHGYAVKGYFPAQNVAGGVAESKIVDSIAAVEEGSVDVEEVGVSGVPVEAGTYEGLRCVRRRQRLHLSLDSNCGSQGTCINEPASVSPARPAFHCARDGGRHRAAGAHPA